MFLMIIRLTQTSPAPVFTPHPADRPAEKETTEPQT